MASVATGVGDFIYEIQSLKMGEMSNVCTYECRMYSDPSRQLTWADTLLPFWDKSRSDRASKH